MRPVALLALVVAHGCAFAPDWSHYPECGSDGTCQAGFVCLTEERRCVPECGERCPDAGLESDAGQDAGTVADAGVDAGAVTPSDAGADGGADAGTDAGLPLALAPGSLVAAVETRPYTHTFSPSGGVGAYHFSIDGGVPGFSLDVGGTLSAAAAPTPGSFPFTLTVQDDAVPRNTVSTGYSLDVQPLLRVASRAPLTDGRQGQAYSEALSATGGVPPYTWSFDGGALPPGLTLSASGTLSGTPSSSGSSFSFVAVVQDSAPVPQLSQRQLGLSVNLVSTLLSIGTGAAADGRVGTAYSQSLKAYGGTQPYAWSITSGALPPGVSLVDTGTLGRIAGTPTDAGTFNFTVHCADTLTSQNQSLSIVVY